MCGIIYTRRNDQKPARKTLLKRYKKQASRGSDGFGFVTMSDSGEVQSYKRFQSEAGLRKGLMECKEGHVLLHHRFPTSTINVPESAHPIRVQHKELQYNYYVAHNGVISNPDELRTQHVKLGYRYTTDLQTQYKTAKGKLFYGETAYNDSEALAIEIARTLEGLQAKVNARGSIAYIVLQVEKGNERLVATYYGTNGGNPLTLDRKNGVTIASEGGTAILPNTCYRLGLDGVETVVSLPMDAHYTASLTSGYGSYGSYGGYYSTGAYYGKDEEDFVPEKHGTHRFTSELQEEYEELMADYEIAMSAKEYTEAAELANQMEELRKEINGTYRLGY